jgi:hypothetical protein
LNIPTDDAELAKSSSRGLLLGCTGILVHSFVDVNLQIPTKAAWFGVLCVVAAPARRVYATPNWKSANLVSRR